VRKQSLFHKRQTYLLQQNKTKCLMRYK